VEREGKRGKTTGRRMRGNEERRDW